MFIKFVEWWNRYVHTSSTTYFHFSFYNGDLVLHFIFLNDLLCVFGKVTSLDRINFKQKKIYWLHVFRFVGNCILSLWM